MRFARLFSSFLIPTFIAGCTSVNTVEVTPTNTSKSLYEAHMQNIAQIQQFTIKGRIGVQTEGKGFSGGIAWQHHATNDDIALYSPLGGQVAGIKKTPESVTLEDAKGNSMSAANVETLTQATLGWRLPLAGLADWSLGRPTASTIDASIWDEQGHLITLKQDGWEIQYENYTEQNGHLLPNKIKLRNDKVNLKLLVENWLDIKNSGDSK